MDRNFSNLIMTSSKLKTRNWNKIFFFQILTWYTFSCETELKAANLIKWLDLSFQTYKKGLKITIVYISFKKLACQLVLTLNINTMLLPASLNYVVIRLYNVGIEIF